MKSTMDNVQSTNQEGVSRVCLNCKHGHEKGLCTGSIFIDGFYCEHKKKWIEMFKKACKDFEPKGGGR